MRSQSSVLFFLLAAIQCFLFALALPLVSSALADQDCSKDYEEILVESKVTTAATWANFRNKPGSLSYESNRLMKLALANEPKAKVESMSPPKCATGCVRSSSPIAVFRSIPMLYLQDYSDRKTCEGLLEKTQVSPLSYKNRNFPTEDSLNDWFQDFSQGKGKDGSDLYAKCSGDCSPQYTYFIVPNPKSGSYSVNAEVLCGHARDKSDNNYKLSLSYRWSCISKVN